MIRYEGVSKDFGRHRAVQELSLEVAEGETMILLGTSGCGKTTTLRMTNRLIEPTSGIIRIGGRDIRDQRPEALRRGIGYVLQHNSLFPHYTIAGNIAVVPKLQGWPESRIHQRIDELMEQLHLPPDLKQAYPGSLSGGQQQRVNVARALAADPAILLMDEPFGALDPVTRSSVREEFTRLDALRRKTILMVTHDVEEAFGLGDRICLMHAGRALQTGTPQELLFCPAHPLVKEFLAGQFLSLALKSVQLHHLRPWMDEEVAAAAGTATIWDVLSDGAGLRSDDFTIAVMTAFNRYQQHFSR